MLIKFIFLLKKSVKPPFVNGLHFPALMLHFFINVLKVRSYLTTIKVNDIFEKLKPLYFLVQLILISHAHVLNLLNFHKIQQNQFLIKSQYVSNRSTYFDVYNLRVGNFFQFEKMAEYIVNYNGTSDTPENHLVKFHT